jgi:hypothetical protein
MKPEFSFAKAISIHRLGASGRTSGNQPKPDPFLKRKHPKVQSRSYLDWRLRPPAVR